MLTWNPSKQPVEEIFALPKGGLVADFGFLCEVSFYESEVETIASALKLANVDKDIRSQAHALVVAQENELECASDYAPLRVS